MRYLILFITTLFCLSFIDDDNVIIWNKDRKLVWSDYKGKPQKRFVAASTVYSLGRKVLKKEDGTIVARIQAYFYCEDSWKKDDWINDDVLAHEQKHFDIVELFSRKMRKQITGMTFLNFSDAEKKVDAMYGLYNEQMDKFQDQYDEETDGSMNGDAQRKWNKNIMAEIEALADYEGIFIPLKIKTK